MTRRVTIIGAVLFVVVLAALLFTVIPKARLKANTERSRNNLREIATFAAYHAAGGNLPSDPRVKRDVGQLRPQVPAGTRVLPDTPPENRLSWVVDVLPGMDQAKQPTTELLTRIDAAKPWSAEPNQAAGLTRLPVLICPENPPEMPPGQPAVTSYVGIAGVGADAATLPPTAPRAGAFRYDAPTLLTVIRDGDGLSQTLLFAETRNEVGPWLRGGSATVRGLLDRPDVPPLVGGQFGGYFPEGGHFAFCDGSVRLFTPATTPQVLLGFATIAGKDTDPIPGD
jgi:hypothetical protein